MASLDIISKVDLQTLDNAINSAKKELATRYDFRDSKTEIDLDKKNMSLKVLTENEMRMDATEKILIGRFVKQQLDPRALDFGKERYASGNMLRKDIKIKQGIDKETAKKIVKDIKDSKLKVNASINDDKVRVEGKKIDDLQAVMAMCRSNQYDVPLQFDNMKS